MPASAEEIRLAFRDGIKALACPHCGERYSDYAADWSEAWSEGRRSTMQEVGYDERDGPIRLKCELCGGRAATTVFLTPPEAL